MKITFSRVHPFTPTGRNPIITPKPGETHDVPEELGEALLKHRDIVDGKPVPVCAREAAPLANKAGAPAETK